MDRRPTTLLAELTHRCPLHCPYCSNPIDLARSQAELSTDDWKRVFAQARELGALQLGLSGGEPLIRRDLEELADHAHTLGFYQTLVTSAVGLTRERAVRLQDTGLEHVQISIQDSEKEIAEKIAGTRSWDTKLQAAAWIKELDFAFTVNVVLHRANLDHLAEIIDMAGALGADRVELANTQYYGWAVLNRESLMPTRAQIERSEAIVDRAVEKYRGTMQIIYVLPDYYSEFPKPCQGGWGNFYLVVAPDGRTMPCHAASQITTLSFDNVRDRSMRWIWEESSAFRAFRGDEWMKEPCRGCPRKHVDFGGCRCQAFALTGDATRTDPVCTLTSDRAIIDAMLDGEPPPAHYTYREMGRTRESASALAGSGVTGAAPE
jgi:pyrroloquinoline quinone biosynthesis protein E